MFENHSAFSYKICTAFLLENLLILFYNLLNLLIFHFYFLLPFLLRNMCFYFIETKQIKMSILPRHKDVEATLVHQLQLAVREPVTVRAHVRKRFIRFSIGCRFTGRVGAIKLDV